MLSIVVFLFLAVAGSTQAAELNCTFMIYPFNRYHYECIGNIEIKPSDYTVASVNGVHKLGLTSSDVSSISICNKSLVTVMPKNFKLWFPNFVELKLDDLPNFPGFKTGDFNELTHLKSFVAMKLPLVTEIPGNAFKDMTNLEVLSLNEMPNLENLQPELLTYATQLEILTVRGPNKINQISPGFFRNQANTLQAIDFTHTRLLKINFSVFDNLKVLTNALFKDSGCLNADFRYWNVKNVLIHEVRKRCRNTNGASDNNIIRKASFSVSSSSSSE